MKVSFFGVKKNAAILAIVALGLNSCAVSNLSSNNLEATGFYGTKWRLTELNGKAVPDKVNGKEPFMMFDKEQKRFSASGGCNGIGGEFEVKANNKISFSRGMSTMMACPDMSIEQGIGQILQKVDKISLKDNGLQLLQGSTVLARMKVSQEEEAGNISSLAGTWELDYVANYSGETFTQLYPSEKPTITFNVDEKKVTGNSSCNNFFGSFTQNNTRNINFGPLGMTRKACPGNGESVFIQGLEKVNTFAVSGNTLTLITGDIAIMRFRKK